MRGIFNIDGPVFTVLNKVADILILNLLTIICCIPIVTIGASMTSMYYVTMKMVKNEEGYIFKSFFKAFKENFKKATILWLIIFIVGAVFFGNICIILFSGIKFPQLVIIVIGALGILFLLVAFYVFPVQARFENTVKNILINSALISFSQLPKTILILIIHVIPFVLLYMIPQTLPIIFLLGLAGVAYIASYIFAGIFKMIEEKQLEAEGNKASESTNDTEGE